MSQNETRKCVDTEITDNTDKMTRRRESGMPGVDTICPDGSISGGPETSYMGNAGSYDRYPNDYGVSDNSYSYPHRYESSGGEVYNEGTGSSLPTYTSSQAGTHVHPNQFLGVYNYNSSMPGIGTHCPHGSSSGGHQTCYLRTAQTHGSSPNIYGVSSNALYYPQYGQCSGSGGHFIQGTGSSLPTYTPSQALTQVYPCQLLGANHCNSNGVGVGIQCPHRSSCNGKYTCCLTRPESYGCCRTQHAVCRCCHQCHRR